MITGFLYPCGRPQYDMPLCVGAPDFPTEHKGRTYVSGSFLNAYTPYETVPQPPGAGNPRHERKMPFFPSFRFSNLTTIFRSSIGRGKPPDMSGKLGIYSVFSV